MGRFSDYFERNGLQKSQITMAVLGFKFSSYAIWTGSLVLCYHFRPVRTIFTKVSGPRRFHEFIKRRYPARYEKTSNYVYSSAERLANWKYFRPIPDFLGVNPRRFTLALAENMVLYKTTLPITIPIQIWIIILALRKNNSDVDLGDLLTTSEFDETIDNDDPVPCAVKE
jgi:hypothetical protein